MGGLVDSNSVLSSRRDNCKEAKQHSWCPGAIIIRLDNTMHTPPLLRSMPHVAPVYLNPPYLYSGPPSKERNTAPRPRRPFSRETQPKPKVNAMQWAFFAPNPPNRGIIIPRLLSS
jgi:hypothetical protein